MLLPVDLHKTDHTLRLKRTYTRLTGWNIVHSSVTETKVYLHASDTNVTENVLKIAGPVLEALKDPKIEPYFRSHQEKSIWLVSAY